MWHLTGSIIFNFIYKIIDIMTKCFTIECNYKEADISFSMTNLCASISSLQKPEKCFGYIYNVQKI